MPIPSNSVNEATTGIVGFTGTAWTATPVTQHDILLGAATSSTLTNVAPSATSGVPLISQGSSSDPAFGTMVTAGGGTGDTSLTAFAVVTGGTTSTAPLQSIASVGTSGQVLTSNGAGVLPTFQASAVSGGIQKVTRQVFTASGTYTPTAGMTYCDIICVGGGGAGGGTTAVTGSNISVGSGGASGSFSQAIFTAATIGASQPVTIGVAAVGISGSTGSQGNACSVGTAGALISSGLAAGGGTPTVSTTNFVQQGGSPGTLGSIAGSGIGGINQQGSAGETAAYHIAIYAFSGLGADSHYGGGSTALSTTGQGIAGVSYGSGGGGAANFGAGVGVWNVGGNAPSGVVIITEYCT